MAGTESRSRSAPSRVDPDQADALARVVAAEPAGVAGAARRRPARPRPAGPARAQAGSRARRPRRSPRTRAPGSADTARRPEPIPFAVEVVEVGAAQPDGLGAQDNVAGLAGPGSGTSTTSIVERARVTAARMPTRSRARSSSPSLACATLLRARAGVAARRRVASLATACHIVAAWREILQT